MRKSAEPTAVTDGLEKFLQNFSELPASVQPRLLLELLLQERQAPTADERHKRELEANFVLTALGALRKAAEKIADGLASIRALEQQASKTMNQDKVRSRGEGIVAENSHVVVMDSMSKALRNEVQYLRAFCETAEQFLKDTNGDATLIDQDKLIATDPHIRDVEMRTDSFLQTMEMMLRRSEDFPEICRKVVRSADHYRKAVVHQFSPSQREHDSASPRSLFDLFHPRPQEREDIPIYQGNIHLTAFLHDIYRGIPVIIERKTNEVPKVNAVELRAFVQYLRSLGDEKLMHYLEKGGFFSAIADTLSNLDTAYRALQEYHRSTGVDQLHGAHPGRGRMLYQLKLQQALCSGSKKDRSKLNSFHPGESLELLRKIDLTTLPAESSALEGQVESKRDRKMLDIFGKIHTQLKDLSSSKISTDDLEQFARALIEWKFDLRGQKRRRRESRMRADTRQDNHRFRVTTSGVNDLELKRVPTTPVTFDDVIGKSWQRVRRHIDGILQYAEREHLHTTLAPRGKAKKNTLLIGPWGSGKNFFSEAVMNDARVIGVSLSTGDIITAYLNESEANIARLFDETVAEHEKLNKPVVMVWDEFDELFPSTDSDGIRDNTRLGMQKELQTSLDGSKDTRGVFLMGLTNDPSRIPIEIYRRMRNVEIIQPLDDVERRLLLERLLTRLPLEQDFFRSLDHCWLNEETANASGEVLGTIVDETYEEFLRVFEEKHPRRLKAINAYAERMVTAGKHLTPKRRVSLFRSGPGKDMSVSVKMFQQCAVRVLQNPAIQREMAAQEEFYQTVDAKLDEAFPQWREWDRLRPGDDSQSV